MTTYDVNMKEWKAALSDNRTRRVIDRYPTAAELPESYKGLAVALIEDRQPSEDVISANAGNVSLHVWPASQEKYARPLIRAIRQSSASGRMIPSLRRRVQI